MEGFNLNEQEFDNGNVAFKKTFNELGELLVDSKNSNIGSVADKLNAADKCCYASFSAAISGLFEEFAEMSFGIEEFIAYMANMFPNNPYFAANFANLRLNKFEMGLEAYKEGELSSEDFTLLYKSFLLELYSNGYINREDTQGLGLEKIAFDFENFLSKGELSEQEERAIAFLYNCYSNIYYNGLYNYFVIDNEENKHYSMFGIASDELLKNAEVALFESYGYNSITDWRENVGIFFEESVLGNLKKRDIVALDYLYEAHDKFDDIFWSYLTGYDPEGITDEDYEKYYNSLSAEQQAEIEKIWDCYEYLSRFYYADDKVMAEMNDYIMSGKKYYFDGLGSVQGELNRYYNDEFAKNDYVKKTEISVRNILWDIPMAMFFGVNSGVMSVVEDIVDGSVMLTVGTAAGWMTSREFLLSLIGDDETAKELHDFNVTMKNKTADFVGNDLSKAGYYWVTDALELEDSSNVLYGISSAAGRFGGYIALSYLTAGSSFLMDLAVAFTATVGDSSEIAIQNGADFDSALAYGVINGAVNAAMQVGCYYLRRRYSCVSYSRTQNLFKRKWVGGKAGAMIRLFGSTGIRLAGSSLNYSAQYAFYAKDLVDENGNPIYANYGDFIKSKLGYIFAIGAIGGAMNNATDDDYVNSLNDELSRISFIYKGRHGGNMGIEAWKFVNYINDK